MPLSFPLLYHARKLVLCLGLGLAIPSGVFGQAGFVPEGGEYAIAGSSPGDQVHPSSGLNASGGYLVWDDNITDGTGQGISARQINSSLSGSYNVFKVNSLVAGSQEKPKVVRLDNDGAVFVWQGGADGKKQIYAQFYSSSGTSITTNDVMVNSIASTNSDHLDAAVAKLSDGNVIVVWSSWDQPNDGNMQGVFAQIFSPAGMKISGEFQINQTTALNQRTPGVAGLSDGNFVVVWVSETQRSELSFDVSIFARRFNSAGTALGSEFKVNTGTNVCANPSLAASSSGGFLVAWGEKDSEVRDNSWDIFGRTFSNAGTGASVQRLNTVRYGDQLGPKVAALSSRYLVVWTSLLQDSSWEGVYGQFLENDGTLAGGEFRINTTVLGKQIHPTVTSDGGSRFLVIWSSFGASINSFDLRAQRYVADSQPLAPPAPPFVTVLSSSTLSLTWPEVGGFNVANYEVYADGAGAATVVITNNWWTRTNLAASSTHYFRLAYVLADGRRSPLSGASTNSTYGSISYSGIPVEWMSLYFGEDWPLANDDSDGDGVSNKNEFLAGTNPTNLNSVLRTRLESTSQGLFLIWNTQPGLMYQVQVSIGMGGWSNIGGPRFASGSTDSLNVGGGNGVLVLYRIVRLR